MSRRLCVTAGALLVALGGLARAQDSGNREMDRRINQGVVAAIKVGVPLYNGGDHAGCYRVYEGALTALDPLLSYKPELKSVVEAGLRDAGQQPSWAQRAVALRTVLDKVFVGTGGVMPRAVDPNSLWARLGGEGAVRAVVRALIQRAATDPKVDFTRSGKYKVEPADLENKLVAFISQAAGGPLKYEGRSMKEVHEGMGITAAQFDAMAADLVAILQQFRVPRREANELVGAVAGTKKDIVEAPGGTPEPSGAAPAEAKSLWDRLGGEKAVRAVVHDFVGRAATDRKVDFTRGGKYKVDVPDLENKLVTFISMAAGGPLKYEGRSMKEVHEGMGITEAQFNAIAADLVASLKKFNVGQKEIDDLVGAVAGTKDDMVEKK